MNHLLLLPLFNYQPFGRLMNVILHLKDINIIYCFSFLRRVAHSRRQAEWDSRSFFSGKYEVTQKVSTNSFAWQLLRQTQGLNCCDGDKFVFKCVYIERVLRFPGRSGASEFLFVTRVGVFLQWLLGSFSHLKLFLTSNSKNSWLLLHSVKTLDVITAQPTSLREIVFFSCVLTLSWNSKLLFLFHGVMHNLFPKYDNWCLVNSKTSWCSASWGDAINDLLASLLKVSERK